MFTKNVLISTRILFLLVGILVFSACQSTQIFKNKKDNIPQTGFIEGPSIGLDKTYQPIKSNVARLQALMSGKFVDQVIKDPTIDTAKTLNIIGVTEITDPEKAISLTEYTKGSYTTWMVNEGNDSIISYHIPVGNPNKVGYWIYHYQVMTSLPDDPIYESFEKLVPINRDTIRSTFYSSPEDFNPPLNELIKKHKNSFESINIKKLVSMDVEEGLYIRQTPLHFKGQSLLDTSDPNTPNRIFYNIYPSHNLYHKVIYRNFETKDLLGILGTKSLKIAMVK